MRIPPRWRVWAITFGIALMAAIVAIGGSLLTGTSAKQTLRPQTEWAKVNRLDLPPLRSEAGAMLSPRRAPWLEGTEGGGRTLSEFYGRRQYPGSPPIIPHPITETMASRDKKRCTSCHAEGGYAETFSAYAPVTPHPSYTECTQCHIPQKDVEPFGGSDWRSVTPPRMFSTGIPTAPPPIPHDLQMREQCLSCHAGPSAIEALRTSHPERGNCRQCHVQQKSTTRSWSPGEEK